MLNDLARPLALDVWKDPQGFVILRYVRDEAWVFFQCWEDAGVEAAFAGCLHFEGVWHVSSTRFGAIRGYPNVADTDLKSYYMRIDDSSLLRSLVAERDEADPAWRDFDRREYAHFVVESHDFYLNLVAASVAFSTVNGAEAKTLFELWNEI